MYYVFKKLIIKILVQHTVNRKIVAHEKIQYFLKYAKKYFPLGLNNKNYYREFDHLKG
jgi:hypothetical protein